MTTPYNLIFETPVDLTDCQVIVESKQENGEKKYKIKGPFLQADMKNGNGRVYPIEVMKEAVDEYVKDKVLNHRALGELSHPESCEVNLERACLKITELKQEDKNFIGTAEILSDNLPCAKMVKGLIESGVKIGVSSRGLGQLDEAEGKKVVKKFKLVAEDIVYDPSAKDCYVEGIVESKQYILDESTGAVYETNAKAYADFENGIATIPNREAEEYLMSKIKKFLNTIKNNI